MIITNIFLNQQLFIMKTKICTKCKEEKPLSEFHKDIQKISELSSSCKECKRLQINRYNKTHQKEKQIYDKKRRNKIII